MSERDTEVEEARDVAEDPLQGNLKLHVGFVIPVHLLT